MILFLHPRSTRPKNRRFPLSILAIAAVIEGKEEYAIVDGNLDPAPAASIDRIMSEKPVELLAVSVMPGPQMVAAIPLCRAFREKYPKVPIVWGGYFATNYCDAALNAKYVDYCVRGQGEETFLELLDALHGRRSLTDIRGLSYKDSFGLHVHNPERPMRPPSDFPRMPYHRLPHVEKYILPTFLGSRTAVHQASIGCPFRCKFCGVVPFSGGREKMEAPEHTAAVLAYLQETYDINAVQFYDNNFYLREDHLRELCERLKPLKLRWWSEGRVDAVLGYSDDTLHKLREAGSAMIFFGSESGSNEALREMNKRLTVEETLALAERIRHFGIIPEFSFVVGNPDAPEAETRQTIDFIRRLKRLNPDAEIIVQHYVPTPHPDGMYGKVDGRIRFPQSPEEWASERWYNYTIRTDPKLPWLPRRVKRLIDDFELVVNCRWPTVQDIYLPEWGRTMLKSLSSWRYALGVYDFPVELELAQKLLSLRKPRFESL